MRCLQYFDETWKDAEFGGVEGHWGLFYSKYVQLFLIDERDD